MRAKRRCVSWFFECKRVIEHVRFSEKMSVKISLHSVFLNFSFKIDWKCLFILNS